MIDSDYVCVVCMSHLFFDPVLHVRPLVVSNYLLLRVIMFYSYNVACVFVVDFASKKIVSPMFAVVYVCARVCVSACIYAFMRVNNFMKQEHH